MQDKFSLKLGAKIQLAIVINVILAVFIGEYVVMQYLGLSGKVGILVNLVINIVIAFIYGLIVSRAITKPLREVLSMLSEISGGKGDLTKKLFSNSKDEISELCQSFNAFLEQLYKMVTEISTLSHELDSSVLCFSHMGKNIEGGSAEHRDKTLEMVREIEHMTTSIGDITQNADTAQEGAEMAEKDAVTGGKVVRQAIKGIEGISGIVHDSSETLKTLKLSADKINQIVVVIDDIADQTNLLALNAAIEAARAGEQGRGFAVVADEVRGLASRTSTATKEISHMISATQNDMSQVTAIMETGVEKVKEGVEFASEACKVLDKIVEQSQNTSKLISNVSSDLDKQKMVKETVSNRMKTIEELVKDSSNNTKQLLSYFTDLTNQVSRLRGIVSSFKL